MCIGTSYYDMAAYILMGYNLLKLFAGSMPVPVSEKAGPSSLNGKNSKPLCFNFSLFLILCSFQGQVMMWLGLLPW
jgi:hypothetical protein